MIQVRTAPGAKRERLTPHGGGLKAAVRAPPERGKANAAVLDLLARALDLPRSALSLAGGETSRDKRIRVEGFSPEEIEQRIRLRLAAGGPPTGGAT